MHEELVTRIKEILAGIDSTESESPNGWWETSTGAEFGRKKLDEVIQAVRDNFTTWRDNLITK